MSSLCLENSAPEPVAEEYLTAPQPSFFHTPHATVLVRYAAADCGDPCVTSITAARLDDQGHERAIIHLTPEKTSAVVCAESPALLELRSALQTQSDEQSTDSIRVLKLIEDFASKVNWRAECFFPQICSRATQFQDLAPLPASPLIPPAVHITDTNTGLRGKAALMSDSVCTELSQRIPGDKVLVLFDFNNLGLANSWGLRKEVDTILAVFAKEIIPNHFHGVPHEMFRIGGDEFALVFQHSVEERVRLKAAVDELIQTRDSLISSADERLQGAQSVALVRQGLRGLLQSCQSEPFRYKDYKEMLANDAGAPGLAETHSGGQIAKLLLQKRAAREGLEKAPVMSVACGAVLLSSAQAGLTPELLHLALGQADKEVHRVKTTEWPYEIDIKPLEPIIQPRRAGHSLIEHVRAAERLWQAGQEDLIPSLPSHVASHELTFRLNRLAAADPNIPQQVLRYNMARGVPLSQFQPPSGADLMHVVTFDIVAFGEINNQIGSDRADEMYSLVAGVAREAYPTEVFVRKNGGELIVLTPDRPDPVSVEMLASKMITLLRLGLGEQRVFAGVDNKYTIDALLPPGARSEILSNTRAFPCVLTSIRDNTLTQRCTLAELLE